MSTVKCNNAQIGQSVTATNNFVLYQPASPDGTVRLGNGNSGSVTDLITVGSTGNLTFANSISLSAASTKTLTLNGGGLTNGLVLDASNNVGIGTASPGARLEISAGTVALSYTSASRFIITNNNAYATNTYFGVNTLYLSNASTTAGTGSGIAFGSTGSGTGSVCTIAGIATNNSGYGSALVFQTRDTSGNDAERMRLDASGNLGLGVTPNSGWISGSRALQILNYSSIIEYSAVTHITNNGYINSASNWVYLNTAAATNYYQNAGQHIWRTAGSGTTGNAITWNTAMTLDASGNLLVGTTSAAQRLTVKGTAVGALSLVFNASSAVMVEVNGSNAINGVDGTPNANGLMRVWRDSGNTRSISAAGTINASGADYAEYMTKAGDFEIAKGDICGIDSSGLLTNVFADAISFVVKSTDPSYVGGDSWGADIEDKDVLEIERQKVDRIAFAGQVPVNVLGAKAGDYIIPVADKEGIKGAAVSNPTFEQYQIAVGKVIAVEADGRAKIIVKVT